MIPFGVVRPGSTLRIPWDSFASATGAPSAVTNYAIGDVSIYKDGNTTQRVAVSPDTVTTSFDGVTGINEATLDLSDNSTAGFYAAGSNYVVVVTPVTIDGQTMSFVAATFTIGYPAAILNTTIATLASQTSFTLTAGPAEDDALNGMWVMIHDVASAVQCGWAIVLDYTGSTKTVTLAAATTYTAAATDNFAVMDRAPLQPATIGRTVVVDANGLADANMVKVGPTGSGTAQTAGDIMADTNDIQARLPAALTAGGNIKADALAWNALATVALPLIPTVAGRTLDVSAGGEAGVDWANIGSPTTANNLSATNIDVDQVVASVSGAVGSVTGAVGSVTAGVTLAASAVQAIWDALTSALTVAGSIGKKLADWTVGTIDTYTGNTKQTGDNFARLGAPAGASVSADIAAVKVDTGNLVTRVGTPSDLGGGATVAANLSDIEAQTDDIGVAGAGLTAAGITAAGVRTAVGLASANLDTQLTTIDDFLDTEVAAIKAKTDNLPASPANEVTLAALVTTVGVAGLGLSAVPDLAGVTTLLSRLSAARAGYLDNLNTLKVKKNAQLAAFPFLMVLSSDHITPATGITVTATRSIDGAAFASCANAVAEVASGVYKITLAAADLNGDTIVLKFTSATCDQRTIVIATQP